MITTIKNDMKQALKDKNKEKLSTLRMLLSTIDTERSKQGLANVEDFTDEQVIGFINRNLKQLGQEIDSLVKADRDTGSQLRQVEFLMEYLPKQLTEEEIVEAVEQAIGEVRAEAGNNFGLLMKHLSSLKGKADMALVSKTAKEMWNK
jgi:uncharacterized protein